MAVNTPLTFLAEVTSRPKRVLNCGSEASSGRMAFTATGRPPGDTPRNTCPMPPWPSRPTSRYGPITFGSPGCNSLTTLTPTPGHENAVPTLRQPCEEDRPWDRNIPAPPLFPRYAHLENWAKKRVRSV